MATTAETVATLQGIKDDADKLSAACAEAIAILNQTPDIPTRLAAVRADVSADNTARLAATDAAIAAAQQTQGM